MVGKKKIAFVKVKVCRKVEKQGCDMIGFSYTSTSFLRNMLLLFGEMVENEVISVDMTDIAISEQILGLIQYILWEW